MASTNFTPFGFIVEFSDQELTQITTMMDSGAAGSSALGGRLAHMGITGTSAAIASAVAALLKSGSRRLNGCNYKHVGIYLFVLWVGPFWCRSRP